MATLPPAPVWNPAKESRAEYLKRYNAWRQQLEAVRAARYAQVAQSHRAPAHVQRKARVEAAKAAAKVQKKPPAQTKPPQQTPAQTKPPGTGEPVPVRKPGESITDFKARYDAWRIAQEEARRAAKAERAKQIIAQSSASAELKQSEIALIEAGREQEAARAAQRVAEAQRRAEEAARIARQQQLLDEARRRRAANVAAGRESAAAAANAERAQRETLRHLQQETAQQQYERLQAAQARERWIQNRKNQLIEEARQAMIRATGRVIAPEQEGRVIAQAIQYATAEYDYHAGLRPTPPAETELPKYDLSKKPSAPYAPPVPGGGGGASTPPPTYEPSPAEHYETAQTAAASSETQQAADLLAQQQAAYDQSAYLYQLLSQLQEIPYAQGPVILEVPAQQAVPIPPPSQLPAVLLGIAGGAILTVGLMGR